MAAFPEGSLFVSDDADEDEESEHDEHEDDLEDDELLADLGERCFSRTLNFMFVYII